MTSEAALGSSPRAPFPTTCPTRVPDSSLGPVRPAKPAMPHSSGIADQDEAEDFLRQFHAEQPDQPVLLGSRLEQVRAAIDATGTYRHTTAELEYGARVAWRNSARCIGRLYWNSLHVFDRRNVTAPAEIHRHLYRHLRQATNGGRIRPVISVFAPDSPGRPGPRVWNEQPIGYWR